MYPCVHIHVHIIDILRKAAKSELNIWWCIKGDSIDVGKGIGNVDLNDGKLNLLQHDYQRLLEETSHIWLDNKQSSQQRLGLLQRE